MNAHNRKPATVQPAPCARSSARRRLASEAARLPVRHLVLPGHEVARVDDWRPGERIGEVLLRAGWASRRRIGRRQAWTFKLPTICILNGAPLLQRHWMRRRLRARDELVFFSRPLGGASSALRSPTGKAVMGIVATVALLAFAPWAAQSAFFLLGGLGVAPAWMTSAVLLGGALFIATLTQPKPGGQNDPAASASQVQQLYTAQAQGNAARLLQPIPVQYGKQKMLPDWAAQPWSEFVGKDQYLNVLLSRGEGRHQIHQVLTDDTVIWDADDGFNDAFEDVSIEHYDPGDPVTLFPVNIATSIEVSGQTLGTDWTGGFVVNNAGTTTNRIYVDVVFPAGLYRVDDDGNLFTQDVTIVIEGRRVDNAGAPLESYAVLRTKEYETKSRKPLRFTEAVDVTAARWDIRVRRTDAEHTGPLQFDQVIWQGLRAAIVESDNVFPVSTTAIRIKGTAFTAQSARRFGVLQTRILPVWDAEEEEWTEVATRNPFWAMLDMATNEVYGAGRALSKMDFQAIADEAAAAAGRGDCFDYIFSGTVPAPDAFDAALGVARARHKWAGDIMSVVRDEYREIPRMLITDREIVRDSVQITYTLNVEDSADAVILEYVDEETWRSAEVQYPPNSESFTAQRPSRIQIPGICQRDKAQEAAAFHWLCHLNRRTHINLSTERDGRMLGFGATVRVQTELPDAWGASGAILFVDGAVLTADRPLTFAAEGQHYIAIRTKTGRQFGPVKCESADPEDLTLIALDETDLALVESQAGMTLDDALERADGAEDPSFDFGVGAARARNCLVMGGTPSGNRVNLRLVVNNEACYPEALDAPPARPSPSPLADSLAPQIAGLYARFRQGVAEPVLAASWQPAAGAATYIAQVSYDGGVTYDPVYEGTDPSFAVVVDYAALRLRVQAVGVRRGAWASVDLDAPEIVVHPGVVELPSLSERTRELIATSQRRVEELRLLAAQLSADLAARMLSGTVEARNLRSDLSVEREGRRAAITEVQEVVILTDAALASLTLTVDAHTTTLGDYGTTLSSHSASITTNQTAIATLDSALSSVSSIVSAHTTAIGDLGDEVADNTADIATNESAITTLDSALGSLTSTVSAQGTTIGGHTTTLATHTSDIAALVSADSAFSSSLTTLTSTVGGHTSTLSTHAASIDGLEAAYTLTLDVNGYVTGYETINDGSLGSFTLSIDEFYIVKPGAISPRLFLESGTSQSGGTTIVLSADVIKAGSIETAGINANAVTNIVASAPGSTVSGIDKESSTGAGDGTLIREETITVTDGTVEVYFEGEFFFVKGTFTSSNKLTLGIYLDSATSPLTGGTRTWNASESDGDGIIVGSQPMSRVFTGLSAGSHTFKVKCINTDWGSGAGSREIRAPYLRLIEFKR